MLRAMRRTITRTLFLYARGVAQLIGLDLHDSSTLSADNINAVQMNVVGNGNHSGLAELVDSRLKLDSLDSTLPPNYMVADDQVILASPTHVELDTSSVLFDWGGRRPPRTHIDPYRRRRDPFGTLRGRSTIPEVDALVPQAEVSPLGGRR